MKVLPPIVVTDAMVISSSVFEYDPGAYAAGTTYALGAYASVADTLGKILIYKSLQAGNIAHTPASSPTWWEYSSSTYEIHSYNKRYPIGQRVIETATHKVYQSVQPENISRPLNGATPWQLMPKATLTLPAVWSSVPTYSVGALVYLYTVMPDDTYSIGVPTGVFKALRANTNQSPSLPSYPADWELVVSYPMPYQTDTIYGIGQVVYDTTGVTYQSLIGPNKNIPFNYSGAAWVEVGFSNKFAPFDQQSSTQAIANKSITYTVATGLIEAVALVNCLGDFATVTVRDGLGGPIVYENTNGIAGDTVSDWYQYLFSDPTIQRKQVLFVDIPPYASSHVTITVTSASTVAIGDALFGRWKDVGLTNFGLQAGITDFSVVTEDGFGGTKFVKRGNKKYMDCRNWIKNEDFNRAFNLLSQLPATPCFWLAGDVPDFSEALGLKAYYKDFSVDISGPQEAYCTLKLIGLI